MKLTVTRKRANQLIKPGDMRALMRGDTQATLRFLPMFLIDGGDYATLEAGRAHIGNISLRDFGELAERFRNELAVTSSERQGLEMAYKKGTATAPGWLTVLNAAKDWGMPPWEIAQDNQRELWFRRYRIVKQIETKASK